MATTLQGSFRVGTPCTIRFEYGTEHVDWAPTVGTVYQNHSALLSAWQTIIRAGLGSSSFVLETVPDPSSPGRMKVRVVTPGGSYGVQWSWTGDGSAIRNFLGEVLDGFGSRASGTLWHSPCLACFSPLSGLQRYVRSETSRARGTGMSLTGRSWTQHRRSPGDVDIISMDLVVWLRGGQEAAAFVAFLEEVNGDDNRGRFTVSHTGFSSLYGAIPGDEVRVQIRPVRAGWSGLYEASMQVRSTLEV